MNSELVRAATARRHAEYSTLSRGCATPDWVHHRLYAPNIPRVAAEKLHRRLKAFQNEYKSLPWRQVRLIRNQNLFLVEEGLRIHLWHADSPSEGYRLAANYCEHYDPRYGNNLNGPSCAKIHEIVRFMFTLEALET